MPSDSKDDQEKTRTNEKRTKTSDVARKIDVDQYAGSRCILFLYQKGRYVETWMKPQNSSRFSILGSICCWTSVISSDVTWRNETEVVFGLANMVSIDVEIA